MKYSNNTPINNIAVAKKTPSATKKTASFQDQLQISQAGRDFQIAKQAVANASDIREDKVAELKTKVDSGNYQVDAGDFASKLLEKYNELY